MSFDLAVFASKLREYRKQFQVELRVVADAIGIPEELLRAYEGGEREPSGDHVLMLSDFYKCDYRFFISNDKVAPFEQTKTLFRRMGDNLTTTDRWRIQEFLFLCECEEYLLCQMAKFPRTQFHFQKQGTYFKQHGIDAAQSLRKHLGYGPTVIAMDVFYDLRSIGIHVFRRSLVNSEISGLFVRHPTAGRCILINESEDVYRQRFTAAHEAGHSILDDGEDVGVTFTRWKENDLSEIRAHTFASHFLMPRESLRSIPQPNMWTHQKVISWASKLKVSTAALANALRDDGLVDIATAAELKTVAVPRDQKTDVEVVGLSDASRARKLQLMNKGLSTMYVGLCFDAYAESLVSAGRLAEMLLVEETELAEIAGLYGRTMSYVD